MLSALSANDPFLANPFSVGFHGGFKFQTATSPKPVTSSTGSDVPEKPQCREKQGSEDSNRKRRRIISNRESARRSRMRKQRHLQNLRNQLNLFRVQNRELKSQLQFLLNHYICVRNEFDWLRSERTLLCQKLSSLSQFMVFQQHQPLSSTWPCYNLTAE